MNCLNWILNRDLPPDEIAPIRIKEFIIDGVP